MGCLKGQLFGDEPSPRPRRVHLDCSPAGAPALSADLAVLAETRLAARTLSISEMAMMGQTGWEGGLSWQQLQDEAVRLSLRSILRGADYCTLPECNEPIFRPKTLLRRSEDESSPAKKSQYRRCPKYFRTPIMLYRPHGPLGPRSADPRFRSRAPKRLNRKCWVQRTSKPFPM